MKQLSAPPNVWKTYYQILSAKRSANFTPQQSLPGLAYRLNGIALSQKRLQRYNRVCGYDLPDMVLATYPQVLAFPLLMNMLASREFPLPVLGLVHTKNSIQYLKPISVADVLDIVVRVAQQRLVEKGLEFDVEIEVFVRDELVWRASMSMLSRCKTDVPKSAKPAQDEPIAKNISQWRLGSGLGRQYGWASGDLNPIHLSALTAKLFGFKRAIAHGMWSKAKSLAELSSQLPPCPYEVTVKFKTPIFLPNTIRFAHCCDEELLRFDLWNRDGSKPHLAGQIKPII